MNAYEMADELESLHLFASQERLAAVMLRKQADRIAELNEECNNLARTVDSMAEELIKTTPQTKPLSDEELLQAIGRAWCSPENSYKELDSVLCLAMVKEIKLAIEAKVRGEK